MSWSEPIYRPSLQPCSIGPISTGAENGCVFCQARQIAGFKAAEKVTILNGRRAGMSGVVAVPMPSIWMSEIAIRGDGHRQCGHYQFALDRTLVAKAPVGPAPPWMPSLSTDDLFCLDEALVRILSVSNEDRATQNGRLFGLIATIWWRRLPVRSEDIMPMLIAHGFESMQCARFAELLEFGLDLLISVHGRPPIKRKRMPAMTAGRYEPARRNKALVELIARLKQW